MVHVQTAADDQTCAGTTERRRVARVGSQAVAVREAVCISLIKVSHGRRGTDMVLSSMVAAAVLATAYTEVYRSLSI